MSLDRVHAQPRPRRRCCVCARSWPPRFPAGCPPSSPRCCPPSWPRVASDRLAYNRTLAAIGRYSLATVSPTTIGLHRLVQAVIQARLGEVGERAWAQTAVALLRESFPNDSWGDQQLAGLRAAAAAPARRHRARRAAPGRRRRRPAGCSTGPRPICANAASTGRLTARRTRGRPHTRPRSAPTTSRSAGAATNSAGCCGTWGTWPAPATQFERALQIGEAALGPDHPDVGTPAQQPRPRAAGPGGPAGARDQFERALQISEAALGPDHPDVGTRRNNLGRVLRTWGT